MVKTAASSKTKKLDGSECLVIIILQVMCNQNEKNTGLIGSSQGFSRCAQILLDKKLVGLRPSKKIGSNELQDLEDLWQPVSNW